MKDRCSVRAEDFFTLTTFFGFATGFFCCLIALLIILAVFDNTNEANMRKALYAEMSGDTRLRSSIDDSSMLNISKYFALYLRTETLKGRTVQDVVRKSELYRKIFDHADEHKDEMQRTLISLFPEDTAPIVMGRNNVWHKIVKNPDNQNALSALLGGDIQNNELLRIEVNPIGNFINKNFWFLLVICSQMGAVWGFMWHIADENRYGEKRWFHLSWGKLGTCVFILFLLPGALIPATCAALRGVFRVDIPKTYRDIKEKRQQKKLAKEKERNSRFDNLPMHAAHSRKDSEALLERLESRVKKGGAGA